MSLSPVPCHSHTNSREAGRVCMKVKMSPSSEDLWSWALLFKKVSVDHAKDDFKEPDIKLFADCLEISPAPNLESRRRVVLWNNLREPSCQKEAVAGWKEILSSVSSYYHASRPSTVSSPPFSVTGSGWKWLARRRVVMRGEAQPLQLTSMAWLYGTSWDH